MSNVKSSFSFYSSPLDLLRQAIAAAERLTKRRYKLLLRRKEEERGIEICLYPQNLYHLFGFHKVKELSPYFVDMNKRAAYAKTLQDERLLARIALSPSFDDIEKRLICICLFDDALKNTGTKAYEFMNQGGYLKTNIAFDYLLTAKAHGHTLFYFIRLIGQNQNKGILVSLFIDDRHPYYKGNKPWEIVSIQ